MTENNRVAIKSEESQNQRGRTSGNWVDLFGTTFASIIVTGLLCLYIYDTSKALILTALLGTTLGWACGLVTSPYNIGETKNMGNISKVASVVIGGYLVSKLDRIFDALIASANKNAESSNEAPYTLATHMSVCVVMFLTAFIFVYVTRTYNFGFRKNA